MFGWSDRRKQLLQEYETHIELETQENLDAGMSPENATKAARKKFGNVLLTAEQSREVWGGLWLERLLQDVRFAVRSLRGAATYTAALLCTLVLGLGSATTMLAIIESTLVHPVALPHSERLVQLYSEDVPQGNSVSPHALSYNVIDQMQRSTRSFAGVSGYNTMVRPVTASDGTRISALTEVMPEFFSVLGVQAKLGRTLGKGDDRASVAVVSDEFWRDRLQADPKAVGSTIKVSGELRVVIGVLPAGIHVSQETSGPIVYLPVWIKASGEDEFKIESALTIARLREGVSAQQALDDARRVFAHADRRYAERDRHLAMRSYRNLVVGDMQRPLLALLGGVGVLLLIACANAANLQIGRAASRMEELATRSALGASFGRLVQQLLTESLLISLLGATLGGALSYAAINLVRHTYATRFPRFDELSVHASVLGCTGMLAVLVGFAASIAPLVHIRQQTTTRFNLRGVSRRSGLPGALVAIQVGLTCVLLVISGLFVRTLQSLQNVKLGFDPHDVTTLVLMPEQQNQDPERSRAIETVLLEQFETLPGVQSVTMQTEVPFSSYNMVLDGATEASGLEYRRGDSAFYSMVSANFVRTSRIRLSRGHDFTTGRGAGSAIEVLVNEALLRKYFAGREVIGETLRFHRNQGETEADLPFLQPMTIIGVVENEMQGGDLGAPYQPMVYLDYRQLPTGSLLSEVFSMTAQYAVRSPLPPSVLASELRAVITKEAPTMVEMNLRSMEDGITQSLGQRRLTLRLVAGFGVVALLLSALGIYGVLTYSVTLRRREIGIRMALGSTRGEAAGLVMHQAGRMALLGLLPGVAGAWAAGYAVRSFLYGVKAFDPASVVVAAGVLLLVFLIAAFLPAIKAAGTDPMETLRAG